MSNNQNSAHEAVNVTAPWAEQYQEILETLADTPDRGARAYDMMRELMLTEADLSLKDFGLAK